MNLRRQEIRTGLLVIFSLAALTTVLLYLGAPGAFVPQHTYHLYFVNAGGIKPGADVMLAGRRVGLVAHIVSPVPEAQRPAQSFEVLIDVQMGANVRLYQNTQVQLVQNSLLGDMVIDFWGGNEEAGVASNGAYFKGGRALGLNDAAPLLVEKLDPMIQSMDETLSVLRGTIGHINRLTAPDSDLPMTFGELRKFSVQLNELSGPKSAFQQSLKNLESLTGPEGSLSHAFQNTELLTAALANNPDLPASLHHLNSASAELSQTLSNVGPHLNQIGRNMAQATDTVKRQPWRLIWPGTKKYPGDSVPPKRPLFAPRPAAAPRPSPPVSASRVLAGGSPRPLIKTAVK